MASFTRKKNAVSIKLDNGTDGEGNQRTVSVSFGALNAMIDLTSATIAAQIIEIAALLEPCLTKTIYAVEGVITGNIQAQ